MKHRSASGPLREDAPMRVLAIWRPPVTAMLDSAVARLQDLA